MADKLQSLLLKLTWSQWLIFSLLLLILIVPAVFSPNIIDDDLHELAVTNNNNLTAKPPFLLYTFFDGNPDNLKKQQITGVYGNWWAHKNVKMSFFRPFPSLLRTIEIKLTTPRWLQHVHSLLWYAYLLIALAFFYRELFKSSNTDDNKTSYIYTGTVTFLAWLLFAFDDAHSLLLLWTANRYSLIAIGTGIWALWAFEKHLNNEMPLWIPVILYTAAFLAGESAISLFGYFFFRAWKNQKKLIPFYTIILVYLISYSAAGFGSDYSGLYHSPFKNPLNFMIAVCKRMPILLGAQLGVATSSFWASFPAGSWIRVVLIIAGYGLFGFLLLQARPYSKREIQLGLGALVSLIPVCAIFPHDRLLLTAGIGFFPIIARYLAGSIKKFTWWFLGITHVVLPILLLPTYIILTMLVFGQIEDIMKSTPQSKSGLKKTVIVNAPSHSLSSNFYATAYVHDWQSAEQGVFVMSQARSDHHLTRLDHNTFEVKARYLETQLEIITRKPDYPFKKGDIVDLQDITIKIEAINNEGKPRKVRYIFKTSPDDYHWLIWDEGRFKEFVLPDPGISITIPMSHFYPIM